MRNGGRAAQLERQASYRDLVHQPTSPIDRARAIQRVRQRVVRESLPCLFSLSLIWLRTRTSAEDYLDSPDIMDPVPRSRFPARASDFKGGGEGDVAGRIPLPSAARVCKLITEELHTWPPILHSIRTSWTAPSG